MLMLQLSEDRYQDILRKCTSKVISAERQVSITELYVKKLSVPLHAAVCNCLSVGMRATVLTHICFHVYTQDMADSCMNWASQTKCIVQIKARIHSIQCH